MRAAGRRTVVVVGGGACGILACAALVREAVGSGRCRLDIHVVEKQPRLGAGVAYATPHSWHLLNMQAAAMSADPADPADFTRWLLERHPDADPGNAYLPRYEYACYLRHRFAATVRAAEQAGIRVETHHAQVLDCRPVDGHFDLTCTPAIRLPIVDAVVLCLGDVTPADFPELADHRHYHPTAWQLDDIAPTATIAVLGTSLTAVDAVVHLHATGHRGPIHCFSRTRAFPTVQPAMLVPYQLRHLTPPPLVAAPPLSLPDVVRLFLAEFRDATDGAVGVSQLMRRARSFDGFAADIDQARAHRNQWYEALDATSRLAPNLWRAMSFQAKAEFLTRYYGLWAVWRHAMALPNALRLQQIHEAGQLRWYPGILAVNRDSHGGFEIRHRQGRTHTSRVDHLVNATGTCFDPRRSTNPLLTNLIEHRILTIHPLGGVDVDFDSLHVTDCQAHLYFLGPLTRGVHFYTNSIETTLTNTARMATHLIAILR